MLSLRGDCEFAGTGIELLAVGCDGGAIQVYAPVDLASGLVGKIPRDGNGREHIAPSLDCSLPHFAAAEVIDADCD